MSFSGAILDQNPRIISPVASQRDPQNEAFFLKIISGGIFKAICPTNSNLVSALLQSQRQELSKRKYFQVRKLSRYERMGHYDLNHRLAYHLREINTESERKAIMRGSNKYKHIGRTGSRLV